MRYCGIQCADAARGQRSPAPLAAIVCALPECDVTFQPRRAVDRCCCERHGKMLWSREARSDGREQSPAWSDKRRDSYHRRRAAKKATSAGAAVIRAEIAKRDRWTCHLCRRLVCMTVAWPDPHSASLDHVVPLSRGGSHDPSNVKLAHLVCNTAKGNREAV